MAVAIAAYATLMTRNRSLLVLWFLVFAVYAVITRLPEVPTFSLDMKVYYRAAESWPPPLGFYTLREPVIWLGLPLIQRVTGGRVVTFLILDIVNALVLIRAMKLLDNGDRWMVSISPTIISSYVFLLGQQNVLRQQTAMVILILAVAYRMRSRKGAFAFFILSAVTHNATAVLFGYWLDVGRRNKAWHGVFITIAGVALMAVALPLLRKSSSVTGFDSRFLYIGVIGLTILVILYANVGFVRSSYFGLVANYIGFMPAIIVLGAAQFERLSMIFLVLLVVELCRTHHELGLKRYLVANAVYALLVLPVFLFPTVRVFLT